MTIKGIPVELLEKLRERAARHHRSMNAEVISLLEDATMAQEETKAIDIETLRQETLQLRERLRARYGQMSDSTVIIREARDSR